MSQQRRWAECPQSLLSKDRRGGVCYSLAHTGDGEDMALELLETLFSASGEKLSVNIGLPGSGGLRTYGTAACAAGIWQEWTEEVPTFLRRPHPLL